MAMFAKKARRITVPLGTCTGQRAALEGLLAFGFSHRVDNSLNMLLIFRG